jgi:phosphoribosylpyrophosphate synthetase
MLAATKQAAARAVLAVMPAFDYLLKDTGAE